MQILKRFGTGLLLWLICSTAYGQQLRLGLNPYTVEKSAVLEIQSSNQGLLFSRISDTSLINALNPPDGMVIFFTTTRELLLRSNGYWQSLTMGNALSEYWSIAGNSNGSRKRLGTVDNFSLPFITNNTERMLIDSMGNVRIGQSAFDAINPEKLLVDAGTTTSYNLISAKGSIDNYLQLNIQNRSNGATASSDIVATADNGNESQNYIDLGINSSGFTNPAYPILSGINNAYLYSTGNDFLIGNATATKNLSFFTGGYAATNERMRIDGTGNIGIGITAPTALLHLKAGTASNNSAPLKFTSGPLMTTAAAGAVEFLTDKFYATIATGAARKELTLNDAALTAGRIPVVTTNGRLTSNANFVWDNTNSRLGVRATTPTAFMHLGAGSATANTAPLKFTTGVNLTTPEAGAVEFNGTHLFVTIGSTRFQLDQQAGTTYTASNGISLTGADFQNNLITGIAGGQTIIGGTAAGNSLTLSSTLHASKGKLIFGTSVYDETNNRLGIGNSTPTEALDITGNLKFSGALMPNNNAGTAGYFLSSNGAGSAPTWNTVALSNLSDATITTPSAGQLLQYNGTKWVNSTPAYLTSIDTTNISSFHQKVRGLFAGVAPISITGGQVSISQATASTNGYLNSTDWNTFNNKLSSIDTTNITSFHQKVRKLLSAGTGISYNNATGVIGNTGVLSVNGNTGALTMDTGYISNFYLKGRSLLNAGTGITYNAATGTISSSVSTSSLWDLAGNSNTVAGTSFLGTTDDKPLVLKSNSNSYLEMGSRNTLGLVQSFPDYTDGTEQVMHLKSALQFNAPAAQFYKPKLFVDANGNFRTKGSSAGTDFFEFGSTGTNNDGGFEFIIGDDGDEPIVFKSYHYVTGMSEMMRLQSGRMAVGSNAFDATNPEKLLIDAGVTSSYNLMTGKGSINNYLQINVQNRSNGNTASSDLVATADNGSESVNYIDLGINSSGFSNTGYPILNGANNAYLYSTGNDFLIGNGTAAKSLQFFTGGYALTNERLRIDGNGTVGINNSAPNTSTKLDVNGAVKLGAKGTVEKNIISFEVAFASATAVPAGTLNTFFSTFLPGALESTFTIPAANTPTTTRGSVSISADQDLPANVSIATSRIASTSTVKIRFLNSGTTAQSIPSGLKLYITITEF